MSEKRFTDVNVDFENSWIRLKDNGDFLIFPISFNDKEEYGLETLEDLLNALSDKIDEQQDKIDEMEKNFDDLVKWSSKIAKRNVVLDEKIAKIQQAIQIAYEEKPYPTIEDIQTKYKELQE